MTLLQQQIKKHRSIRKYKPIPVTDELIHEILESGTRASSSGNMQAYSVIVTQSQNLKEKMLKAHFNQSMVLEAPVLLTFCADFHRMRKWLKLSKAPLNFDNLMSFLIATIDATLFSQNVALAAESRGLGICYMGTTLASCGEIAKILKCPDHVVPVVGFSLGYPDEDPQPRSRLPLEGLVHKEVYKDYTKTQIKKIYCKKEREGFARFMSQELLKKKVLSSGSKNLAQIYTKIKYTRESHIEYSEIVTNCLKQKGFL